MRPGKITVAAHRMLLRAIDGVMTSHPRLLRELDRIEKGATAMNQPNRELRKPSYWQLVFSQSKVNGAPYFGENLPGRSWDWPKDTYLQRRLQETKWF